MGKKIVAFGEVLWDVLPNGKVLGGTPSNLVFRSNLFGEDGYLLSRIGNDKHGKEILLKLGKLGISADNIQIDSEFDTGVVFITFDDFQQPKYDVKTDVAFDHIEFSAEALKLARNADCLFFGLLPLRFGISKNTIRELIKESPGSLKFFDLKLFDHFFNKQLVISLLYESDVVRIKEKEVDFLAKELELVSTNLAEFGKKITEKYGAKIVLITRGENGVLAYHCKRGAFSESGYHIMPLDNIGSGMAFSAGFLHYYLNGEPIEESLAFGNAAGALNTTLRGATSVFNKLDVIKFMAETPKKPGIQ